MYTFVNSNFQNKSFVVLILRNPSFDASFKVQRPAARQAPLVQRVLVVRRDLTPAGSGRAAGLAMEHDKRDVRQHGDGAGAGLVERVRGEVDRVGDRVGLWVLSGNRGSASGLSRTLSF